MLRLFSLRHLIGARRNRISFFLLLAAAAGAHAQTPSIQVLDSFALHPPVGARVAIVEFADLQCPACATANPTLKAAAAKYKIPWIRHDFLIPTHNWSRYAAIDARWFDLKSKALGDEYRDQVFAYIDAEDTPRPLYWQLDLLASTGFRDVDVLHKNSCFATFGAVK